MDRIENHPILGPRKTKREPVDFTFNGEKWAGLKGEPIAAALLALGLRTLRRHEESGSPRGLYCSIGHCMECRVNVQGKGSVRACLTPLEAGMCISEGERLPNEITGRRLP
ncbi:MULTISPECIES: 2Fe-2S iron-sulfur cluster-binding protein [Paenibacillus]|uniref:Sarcosine oxidase subunit alpha n=2 Tax=Paenibacillus TaxID=44249 RepID=A0A1R1F0G3_9BACL|nr:MULTISPECIES: 2Fe-2S iron-sulfur cluster-binding protein [Paenibacillus]OMF57560.1 sarcosine oxidase subunit alpha [Paenibacillus rhizosphaerae]UYO02707.1 (2Fe-2S)-binding protein [Paenibacillus sp. PSB04]GIO54231.1 sarcosine oxidase subunit alpha [Paenibacillus cineris]